MIRLFKYWIKQFKLLKEVPQAIPEASFESNGALGD